MTKPVTAVAVMLLASLSGCGRSSPSPPQAKPVASNIEVTKLDDGSVRIKTSSAEFELSPRTYLRASLLADAGKRSLDDPAANQSGSAVIADGKPVTDFTVDPATISISEASGKLGPSGKRVDATAKSAQSGLEEKLAIIDAKIKRFRQVG